MYQKMSTSLAVFSQTVTNYECFNIHQSRRNVSRITCFPPVMMLNVKL
jgi:hypothetical protein